MILLLKISSKLCPACAKLSSHWSDTKHSAESLGIKVVSVELSKITDKLDSSKFPACMVKGLRFFPTLIMMSDSTWRDCDNKWSNENVLIFNGEIDYRGVIVSKSHGYSISSSKSVLSWIINSNSLLNTSSHPAPAHPTSSSPSTHRPKKKGPVYVGVPFDSRIKPSEEYY